MDKWKVLGHFFQRFVRNGFFVKRTLNFFIFIRIKLLNAFFTKWMTTSQDHRLSFLQIIIFHANWTLQNSDFIFFWLVITIVISQILFVQRDFLVPIEKLHLGSFKKRIWIFNFFFVWVCKFFFFLNRCFVVI